MLLMTNPLLPLGCGNHRLGQANTCGVGAGGALVSGQGLAAGYSGAHVDEGRGNTGARSASVAFSSVIDSRRMPGRSG